MVVKWKTQNLVSQEVILHFLIISVTVEQDASSDDNIQH